MPVINITLGKVSTEQKKELVEKLTTAAMEITNIPEQEFTCIINELPYENLGRGRQTVKERLEKMSK